MAASNSQRKADLRLAQQRHTASRVDRGSASCQCCNQPTSLISPRQASSSPPATPLPSSPRVAARIKQVASGNDQSRAAVMRAAEHLAGGYPEQTQTQTATTSWTGQGRRPSQRLLVCLLVPVPTRPSLLLLLLLRAAMLHDPKPSAQDEIPGY